MNRIQIQTIVAVVLFVGVNITVYGQPGDPGGDPDVPITGIEYLIGFGGLLGIKKILSSSKRKQSTK
jgi:hypothetical protein